jgi:molybdopterin-guanine dinucleotide biosynthesis protein A
MKRAYLLAGGQSKRFGSDKARVEVHGVPQVVRLASAMQQLGWQVAVVAQASASYEDLGLVTLVDAQPHGGPLAGVLTALTDCEESRTPTCLIANCDLIVWDWSWLSAMEKLQGESIVIFDSIAFAPLPGLYATHVLEPANRLWNDGKRSLRDLHHQLRGSISRLVWPADEIPRAFNTRDELQAILDQRLGDPPLT